MKKVINGKVYNTETATEVADWENGYECGDFHYMYETLYRSRKGQWFIVGGGGPMSVYSETHGNTTSGRRNVFSLIDEETARGWLEDHADPEILLQYFDIEEG